MGIFLTLIYFFARHIAKYLTKENGFYREAAHYHFTPRYMCVKILLKIKYIGGKRII